LNEEPVMYIVVNKDLKIGRGKVAAQVAHSAVKASHMAYTLDSVPSEGPTERRLSKSNCTVWESWFRGSYTKVVLKASEYEMKMLIDKYPRICCWTFDEGRTQIAKGSLTTVAFVPMMRSEFPKEVKEMKLL